MKEKQENKIEKPIQKIESNEETDLVEDINNYADVNIEEVEDNQFENADDGDKIIFSVNTPYNYERYKALLYFNMNKKNAAALIINICAVLLIIIAIILMVVAKDFGNGMLALCMSVIFIGMVRIMPLMQARLIKKSDGLLGRISHTFDFYGDYYIYKNEQGSSKIYYDEIYKVFETKDAFYIYLSKIYVYDIDKSGFTVGQVDKFKEFVIAKFGERFISKIK